MLLTRSSSKPGAFVVNALVVSTASKLKRCQQTPMLGTATTNDEMTCLKGLADLERMEGPWLQGMATSDPETTAAVVRLLLAQMTRTSKRLLGAMVLDRLDAESSSTSCQRAGFCQRAESLRSVALEWWWGPSSPRGSIG